MTKKICITLLLSFAIISILAKYIFDITPSLNGFYQSKKDVNGYLVQISFQQDNNSFVEYIDNREVDKGTYEKSASNTYMMVSDKQNFKITLNKGNSFEIFIKKLNNGNPIQMRNISAVPTTFSTTFDDVAGYKTLLD